jgi:hypothetical protein
VIKFHGGGNNSESAKLFGGRCPEGSGFFKNL